MNWKRDRQKLNMKKKRLITKPCEECGSFQHQIPSLLCKRWVARIRNNPDYKVGQIRDILKDKS